MPLEDVIANLERAWETSDLDLLMQHVALDGQVEIYQEGELLYRLTRAEFRQRNEDAFRRYRTLEMRFEKPELLSETETVATGTHVFRDDQGEVRRVRVIYAFRQQDRRWWLVGVDFARAAEEQELAPAVAPPEAEPGPEANIRDVSLLWARRIRLSSLWKQAAPIRLATLRYRVGDADATYDLEGMRGIAPNTIAWALYHRGEQAPLETGAVDAAQMDPAAWITLRVLSGAAADPALATGGDPNAKVAPLPLRWIAAGHSLVVHETVAPPAPKPSARSTAKPPARRARSPLPLRRPKPRVG
jgi:hypothetical protein